MQDPLNTRKKSPYRSGSNLPAVTCHCLSLSTGGVIAYISSGSASSPESCMSSSPSGGYLSTSPTQSRPALPSRAVGMVVDIAPPAKNEHPRGGMEKAGRSSTSAKSSITSKQQHPGSFRNRGNFYMWRGARESPLVICFCRNQWNGAVVQGVRRCGLGLPLWRACL